MVVIVWLVSKENLKKENKARLERTSTCTTKFTEINCVVLVISKRVSYFVVFFIALYRLGSN